MAFGQEINPESYAICKSDMLIKGQDVGNMKFGNSFTVDGLSSNDDAAGLVGMPYGLDAMEQFQVVTSGGQAELGRALAGYVNVITRSGTNEVRGTAYG